jgi:hypothetical protein
MARPHLRAILKLVGFGASCMPSWSGEEVSPYMIWSAGWTL